MLVDMHLHESTYSSDSKMTLAEIVSDAKAKGAWTVSASPTTTAWGSKKWRKPIPKKWISPHFCRGGILFPVGDITAFGIDSFPSERIDAQEFIDFVASQGDSVSPATRSGNNTGLEHHLKDVHAWAGGGAQWKHLFGGQPGSPSLLQ